MYGEKSHICSGKQSIVCFIIDQKLYLSLIGGPTGWEGKKKILENKPMGVIFSRKHSPGERFMGGEDLTFNFTPGTTYYASTSDNFSLIFRKLCNLQIGCIHH